MEELEEEVDVENFEHKCVECGKTYSSTSNLNKHAIEKHGVDSSTIAVKAAQKCPLCENHFPSKKAINDHLQTYHQVELITEHLEFPSLDEFSKWKLETEKQDSCMFIKRSGTKKRKGAKWTMYYCQRSGIPNYRGVGLRRMRIQGSVRMNATCPSWMKVVENGANVRVEFIRTHVGHSNELAHLGFVKRERNPWKHVRNGS